MATTITRSLGRKGCPNYPAAYKLQVAEASCEPNVSVAKLAQSHGLNANMVFKWRRQYRAGLLGGAKGGKADLVPIAVITESMPAEAPMPAVPAQSPAATIEIELNGARVRVIGMVDPLQLRLVLRCLMPA